MMELEDMADLKSAPRGNPGSGFKSPWHYNNFY